jgi:hypothetical protein
MKNDTSPEVLAEWHRRYQELSPEERLKRGFSLMEAGRAMAELAVRKRLPGASEQQFKRELVRWLYGDSGVATFDGSDIPSSEP